MEEEIWKDIQGYEGYYQASSLGRIKSLERFVSYKRDAAKQKCLKEEILKLCKYPKSNNPDDYYLGVMLCKNSDEKCFRVNRLIAETFIPNPKNLPEVNHLNKIK